MTADITGRDACPTTISGTQVTLTSTVGQTVTLTATASSGLAITYSVLPTSGYTGAATISGSKITFTQAGYLKLAADQPGNSVYAPAPQYRQNVYIAP